MCSPVDLATVTQRFMKTIDSTHCLRRLTQPRSRLVVASIGGLALSAFLIVLLLRENTAVPAVRRSIDVSQTGQRSNGAHPENRADSVLHTRTPTPVEIPPAVADADTSPATDAVPAPPSFKDFALMRTLAAKAGLVVPAGIRLPPDAWQELAAATDSFIAKTRGIEGRRGPLAFAAVNRKVAAGDYEEIPHPSTATGPAERKLLEQRLRDARRERFAGELVNLQGSSKFIRIVRLVPENDPELAPLHQELATLQKNYLATVASQVAPYLK